MNTTKFKNVADAAAYLAEDRTVAQRVNSEIGRNALVAALLEMRVAKNLTQEDIAKAMGCDASTISRIESGNDRQLKWTDILGYASALKVQISILFDDESVPAAARIKQCVLKIDEDLKRLAKLAEQAGRDDAIAQGINRFYREVLFNFLSRYAKNHDKLSDVIKISPKSSSMCIPERTRSRASELLPAVTQDE